LGSLYALVDHKINDKYDIKPDEIMTYVSCAENPKTKKLRGLSLRHWYDIASF